MQREYSDPAKRAYCKRHGIRLFEIPYSENVTDRVIDIMLDMFDVE